MLFEDAASIADPRAMRPDLVEFTSSDREELATGISKLPAREAEVLRLRYGLGERDEPMTLREIGKSLALSRERVRQLEQSAVARLKVLLEERPAPRGKASPRGRAPTRRAAAKRPPS